MREKIQFHQDFFSSNVQLSFTIKTVSATISNLSFANNKFSDFRQEKNLINTVATNSTISFATNIITAFATNTITVVITNSITAGCNHALTTSQLFPSTNLLIIGKKTRKKVICQAWRKCSTKRLNLLRYQIIIDTILKKIYILISKKLIEEKK